MATAVNWGAWADVGMAADLGDAHRDRQAAEGISAIPIEQGLLALERLMEAETPQVGVLPVDWARFVDAFHAGRVPAFLEDMLVTSRGPSPAPAPAVSGAPAVRPELVEQMASLEGDARREAVTAFVQRAVLTILDLPPGRVLDPEKSLIDHGLDSLLAVELKNAILDGGVDIPVARVMTGPPLSTVVSMVLQSLDEGAGVALPVGADEDPEPLVPEIGVEVRAGRSEGGVGEPAIHPILSHMLAMGFGMILLIVLYVVAVHFSATPEAPAEEPVAEEPASKSPRTRTRPRRGRQ